MPQILPLEWDEIKKRYPTEAVEEPEAAARSAAVRSAEDLFFGHIPFATKKRNQSPNHGIGTSKK